MKKKTIIKTEKISYTYPIAEDFTDEKKESPKTEAVKALDNVNLEVEAGQFICILGANGSGKSTLARHLNALLVPDEGSVWINDMSTGDEAFLWNIRSDVGMVFQNPDNQMVASQISEEVAFGLENMGVPSPEMFQRVNDALMAVGLGDKFKENPNNLSGGQKQRVAVASILAMQPKCIVLDESTAMLDPRGRKEIMDTVKKLNKDSGITIICITHYMEEALEADNVFVMKDGSVVLQGSPEEIFCKEDILKSAGLMLPVICQIASRLRQKGMDIPKDVLKAKQLASCLNAR